MHFDQSSVLSFAPLIVPIQCDQGRRKQSTQQWLGPEQLACDWIGGICYADTLQVWFPAHWAPVVLQQLQRKEDSYRAENPSWMDQEEAPRIFESNDRRQEPTGECSSRLAIIEMVTEKATFVCKLAPSKQIGYSCRLNGTLLPFLH